MISSKSTSTNRVSCLRVLTTVGGNTGQERSLDTTERSPSTLLIDRGIDGRVGESDPGRSSSAKRGLVLSWRSDR